MKIKRFLRKYIFLGLLINIVRISLIIAFIVALHYRDILSLGMIIIVFISTFFSRFFELRGIRIPIELTIIIIFFIYGTFFLGDVCGFYAKYYWWDSVYHFFSGVILGLIGFIILNTLFKAYEIESPIYMICFFAFCFAITGGALWEITEFSFDEIFGLNSQIARGLLNPDGTFDSRLGLMDTMKDVILDTTGALISALIGYKYLKNGESFKWFDYIVKKSEILNIKLFKKSKQ